MKTYDRINCIILDIVLAFDAQRTHSVQQYTQRENERYTPYIENEMLRKKNIEILSLKIKVLKSFHIFEFLTNIILI